jgi:TetR/AcrR family transcriptional regulator, transcriptional repressor for nem operon
VEAVVERAMNVFWSRGDHGTAVPDLLRATKLSRGSLYAAFGGKHALFLRALDRYIAERQAWMDVELDPRGAPTIWYLKNILESSFSRLQLYDQQTKWVHDIN